MDFNDDLIEDENLNSQIEFPAEVQNAIEQVIIILIIFIYLFLIFEKSFTIAKKSERSFFLQSCILQLLNKQTNYYK